MRRRRVRLAFAGWRPNPSSCVYEQDDLPGRDCVAQIARCDQQAWPGRCPARRRAGRPAARSRAAARSRMTPGRGWPRAGRARHPLEGASSTRASATPRAGSAPSSPTRRCAAGATGGVSCAAARDDDRRERRRPRHLHVRSPAARRSTSRRAGRSFPGAVLVGGTPDEPFPSDQWDKVTLAGFFSAKARRGAASFAGARIALYPGRRSTALVSYAGVSWGAARRARCAAPRAAASARRGSSSWLPSRVAVSRPASRSWRTWTDAVGWATPTRWAISPTVAGRRGRARSG